MAALALVASAAPANAGTSVAAGTLANDTMWDSTGSPYILQGNVTVSSGVRLTVEAGTDVRFDGNYTLTIYGGLTVNGTWGAPVTFAPNASVARFGGIKIDGADLECPLSNVSMNLVNIGLAVLTPAGNVTLADFTVTNASWWAVNVQNTSARFSAVNLTIRVAGEGLRIDHSSGINVSHMTADRITSINQTYPELYFYGIDAFKSTDLRFDNLTFRAAGVYLPYCDRVALSDLDMRLMNSTSADPAIEQFGDVVTLARALLVGYNTAVVLLSTNANVTDISNGDNATSPAMGHLIYMQGGYSHISRVHATHLWGFAVQVSGVGYVIDNVSAVGVGTGLDAKCSCEIDNITVDNSSRGISVAGTPYWGGAVVHSVRITSTSQPFIAGLGGNPDESDVDFREGVAADGVPILSYHNAVSPPAVRGGNYSWFYVYNSSGLSVRDINLSVGGSNAMAVLVGANNSLWANTTLPAGEPTVVIGWSNHLTLFNISVSANNYAVTARDSDRLFVENCTFDSAYGPAFQGDRLTNTVWRNLTILGTWLVDNYGVNNTVVAANSAAGLAFDHTQGVRVLDSYVCNPGASAALQFTWVVSGLVKNLTSCAGARAVSIVYSSSVEVANSTIDRASVAVELWQTTGALIRWNNITNATQYGFWAHGAGGSGNRVYENACFTSAMCAKDEGDANATIWYNASTHRGNYWDNYTGIDADGDHIGDTPYPIPGVGSEDLYPLMLVWDAEPPVARLLVPSVVSEDVWVPLDGSNSTDNRGLAGASWRIVEGTKVTNISGLSVRYTFADPGTFSVTLSVWDGWNHTSNATANITVLDVTPPYAPDQLLTVDEDTPVTLAFNVSDNDPAWPTGANYSWGIAGGWVPFYYNRYTNVPQLTLTFSSAGAYIVTLEARDRANNTADFTIGLTVRDTTMPAFDFVATMNATVNETDTVGFQLVNFSDNDPSFPGAGAFSWKATGPGGFSKSGTLTAFGFQVPYPGDFIVRYAVRDPSGNEAGGALNFTAYDALPPRWTPPGTVTATDQIPVNVSAENAFDASGVSSAVWSEGGVQLASGVNASFLLTRPGDHVINVNLSDPFGHSAQFLFLVVVRDTLAPYRADPTVNATRHVKQGVNVVIDGRAGLADNDPGFPGSGAFSWSVDTLNATWSSQRLDPTAVVRFSRIGFANLTLTASDAAGNRMTVVYPIEVLDGEPPVGLAPQVRPVSPVMLGAPFRFTVNATDASVVTFTWKFGDGESATGAEVNHTYAQAGNYTVVVNATDALGNSAEATLRVAVKAPPTSGGPPPGDSGGGPAGNGTGPGAPSNVSPSLLYGGLAAAGTAAAVVGALLMRRSRASATAKPRRASTSTQTPQQQAASEAAREKAEYERLYGAPPPPGK